MKWPWTSRARLDDALDQIQWLRERNVQLEEHLRRMDRVEHKLPETPRQPKPPIEPMPEGLRKYIDGFPTDLRRTQLTEAYRRRTGGQSWAAIALDVMPPPEEGP